MSTRKVEHKAERKQTLTLDELAAFVQEAMRAGANGNEHPKIDPTPIGGRIRKISVDVDTAAKSESTKTL